MTSAGLEHIVGWVALGVGGAFCLFVAGVFALAAFWWPLLDEEDDR